MADNSRTGSNGYGGNNRLYRSADRGCLAGVCAGLADYFGVDTNITRLLVAVGAFFFPILILAYIALALLLPKRSSFDEGVSPNGELRRRVRAEPHWALGSVRHRFRELDRRLQRLEKYVTSERFKLDREFEGLKD